MVWWLLILIVGAFGLGVWRGAPYLPTRSADRGRLIEATGLRPGQLLLDLGAGDGALLLAAARRGLRAYGYEINPWLVLVAWWRCRHYRRLVTIRWGDFWQAQWPPADAVSVFLIRHRMKQLDQRLQAWGRPVTLVSYVYEIPGRRPVISDQNLWVYHYPF